MTEELLARARALYASGDKVAAVGIYDSILRDQPDEPRALCLRGLIHRDQGDILAAEKDFRRAIKVAPDMSLPYQLLGDLLHNAKHLIMAADVYERGLARQPDDIMLLGNLAHTRLGLGHFSVSLELSRRVVTLDPNNQESWFRIGSSLCRLGRFTEAIAPLREAIRRRADCLRSRAALYVALSRSGQTDDAERLLEETEPLFEARFEHLNQFNEVLVWLADTETAFRILSSFVTRHPDHADAWNLFARLQIVSGDEQVGNTMLAKAARLAPDDAETALTYGLQLFKFGDFKQGLELYRKRWKRQNRDPREGWWAIDAPAWQGEVLREGALQIWTEQGIGDLVMFAGFFAPLADFAPRVMIESISRFRRLFERSFPWAEIYQRDQLEQGFVQKRDVRAHAPTGDLPLLLNCDLENLPQRQGYLVPDAAMMWRLRERYRARFPGKTIVGISWRSGNKSSSTTRSAELEHWRKILTRLDLGFVSLQYGSVESEVAAVNDRFGADILVDPEIDPLMDLDAFAAQVAAVDLVISVDNSTVHFAGGLGKPCWVLLPFVADWRWLRDRSDTIWYDSLRLFRQKSPDAWGDLMDDLARALSHERLSENAALLSFMHRAAKQAANAPASNDAELLYRRILQINPQDAIALNGLGRIGLATGHVAEVRPFLAAAAAIAPVAPAFEYDVVRAEQMGRVEEHAASREIADWDGVRGSVTRLFLYSTGHLAGDIAAVAELAELRAEVGHVIVECHASLVPLLARTDRRISAFAAGSLSAAELAGFDVTGRLPLRGLLPAQTQHPKWLEADPVRAAAEAAKLREKCGDRKLVGIAWTQEGSWAGTTPADWLGVDDAEWRRIFALRGFGFVVLQERMEATTLANVAINPDSVVVVEPGYDLRRRPDNFAAALAAVDIVVAPLGATAWLATALGKACHLLAPREGGALPPCRNVYRQSRNGSWRRAIEDLIDAVQSQ
ncbi:tetratricopeptide repeat protein [Dongia sp.]|uniref:tetratricopeptide repeat protein n=1 Tax=Dongia sp. TaxID=1977262 RepID=UPI0035B0476A